MTEFIGTFFLVLTVCLTAGHTTFAPLAIGCSLMIMVYMGGHISGGHYNPAVSLAVLLRGKLDVKHFVPYVVAQVAGAMVASFFAFSMPLNLNLPHPGNAVTTTQAVTIEVLFTFALALVVLNSATSAKTAGNSFYGLAIGFTVVVAAFAGGPISGGAFNPAVGMGPTLTQYFLGDEASLTHLWIYIVGPLVGGVLAALVFRIQEEPATSPGTK